MGKPGGATGDRGSADHDLWSVCKDLDLPIMMVDASDYTIKAATESFLRVVDKTSADVVGCPVWELFVEDEELSVRNALDAISSGMIESYRAHRVLDRTHHGPVRVAVWVHAFDIEGRRYAMGQLSVESDARLSPLAEHLGYTPPKLAFGMTNAKGIVEYVSSDVRDVLGVAPHDLIGQPLLRSDEQLDTWRVLDIDRRGAGQSSISVRIRPFNKDGEHRHLRCVITAFVKTRNFGFILIPEDDVPPPESGDRVAQLEKHLWRIANEVQSSGIFDDLGSLPDATRFPAIGQLSSREWEVLSRLLRGQRVPAIAAALYVSPSTVRNNLSQIFRKFGVHSQSALLDLLNSPDRTT